MPDFRTLLYPELTLIEPTHLRQLAGNHDENAQRHGNLQMLVGEELLAKEHVAEAGKQPQERDARAEDALVVHDEQQQHNVLHGQVQGLSPRSVVLGREMEIER